MHGQISQDVVVEVPAAEVWEVFRGLELGNIINKLLQDVMGTVEVVQGDGGPGTILKVTFPPGTPGVGYMKEIFTKVDDEIRLKETEMIEGGYKAIGFDLYRSSFQIIEKDGESCIVRTTVEYEIDDKLQRRASKVTTKTMEMLAEVAGKYIKENRCPTN
ncbi:hypothetical protein COLO4_08129 [Corchorus olitorius]|uniref:Bet v I/Major latex protein domain-containing protein n=1 Tax=Corchorus olitorius TaxID=93759 RepID=A0A1R3KH76_9ROSI|nr:hypothetical protein COLO4_08129 [Corchorus olitorius]